MSLEVADIDEFLSTLSDDPVDIGSWDDYQEQRPMPVPAGTYNGNLEQVRELSPFIKKEEEHFRALLDLRIVGGEQDERTVNFVRVDTSPRPFGNHASSMTDLLKAAGLDQPGIEHPKQQGELFRRLVAERDSRPFRFRVNWSAYCKTCFESKLSELAGITTYAEAKAGNLWDEFNAAQKFARKAKSIRDFPEGRNGAKLDTFECRDCQSQLSARVSVTGFYSING